MSSTLLDQIPLKSDLTRVKGSELIPLMADNSILSVNELTDYVLSTLLQSNPIQTLLLQQMVSQSSGNGLYLDADGKLVVDPSATDTGSGTSPRPAPGRRSANVTIANRLLVIDGSGKWIYADCREESHIGNVVGMTIESAAAGAVISRVESNGFITNPGWNWVIGQKLYLGIEGEITPDYSLGVFTLPVGFATGVHEVFLQLGRAIRRPL